MKRARTILFWGHLTAGVSAGLVIFVMSVTGALLAFEPQILAWLEQDVRLVSPGDERLSTDAVVAAAIAVRTGERPTSLTIDADPHASVPVAFGREAIVYVDPYSGRVLGEGAQTARAFFQSVTEWHRWLARSGDGRQTARTITGASTVAFLLLATSGFFLWMPRRWTLRGVRAVMWFQRGGTPRARDFNWHNVIGFWCAPAIVVMSATAIVMSFPWANRLVYQLAGTPLPAQQARPAAARAGAADRSRDGASTRQAAIAATANLDRALAQAAQQMPTWKTITLRFAGQPDGPLALTLVDGAYWNPYARSTLTVDGDTGSVIRWEPYARQSRGQKWRGWIRFAHTGELGGAVTQGVAGLACLGGAFLVWTGFSLAIRRLSASRLVKRPGRRVVAAGAVERVQGGRPSWNDAVENRGSVVESSRFESAGLNAQ